jgi:hypothetical protein
VTSLSELSYGITMGTDTSQASHTPEHTDAMIQALIDSGRRTVFDYSGGTDRSAQGFPYEYPGAIGNTTSGIGRLAKRYFSSKDQLVTLGFAGSPTEAFPGAGYTGWQLGRAFGALINNHNVGSPQTVTSRYRRSATTRSRASRPHGKSGATGARIPRSRSSSRCR